MAGSNNELPTRKAGYLANNQRLGLVTFDDLFGIRGMGAKSVLDFACVFEAAIEWLSVESVTSIGLGSRLLDEPWIDLVSEEDPRFTGTLPPGKGTLQQRLDLVTRAGTHHRPNEQA